MKCRTWRSSTAWQRCSPSSSSLCNEGGLPRAHRSQPRWAERCCEKPCGGHQGQAVCGMADEGVCGYQYVMLCAVCCLPQPRSSPACNAHLRLEELSLGIRFSWGLASQLLSVTPTCPRYGRFYTSAKAWTHAGAPQAAPRPRPLRRRRRGRSGVSHQGPFRALPMQ